MIPNQRRWERPSNSKALLPPSRSGSFPVDMLQNPQSRLRRGLVCNRLAGLPEIPASLARVVAERMPTYSARLVVAIDLAMEIGTGADELCDYAATCDWMHLEVPNHRITSNDLIELAGRIAARAKIQGVDSNQIYLFATGRGADIALQLIKLKPSNFGGIGIVDGCCESPDKSLGLTRKLKKRAYLAASTRGSEIRQMLQLCRLLNSAGMQVTSNLCAVPSIDGQVSAKRVQDFVRWTRRVNP